MEKIDIQAWMKQPLIWAERCRGRSLGWTPDANWFVNDPLGPVPHCHIDASEIGFLAQGSLEIEIGGTKRVYTAGDFIIMPPNKYHNYWFKGDDPVCFFVAVAPNHKYSRFHTKDFTPDMYEGDAPYANVYTDDPLPSDAQFQCEKMTLQPNESEPARLLELQERIIYIVSGAAQVHSNRLSGTLTANQYLHIPATTPHQIGNAGFEPLMFISMIITDPYTAHGTEPEYEVE
ncbi:MAG: cupin domain-containing protein [Chloroflexota bacterium]|nr:cupin domain-containing protein [Chloroflexota bacterium]